MSSVKFLTPIVDLQSKYPTEFFADGTVGVFEIYVFFFFLNLFMAHQGLSVFQYSYIVNELWVGEVCDGITTTQ